MTRQELDAIAERLAAHAIKIGLSDAYSARITWANEGTSVYLTLPGCRKVRVADHGAAYPCSISVDPEGMSEPEAMAWLDAEMAEEEPEATLEEIEAMIAAERANV